MPSFACAWRRCLRGSNRACVMALVRGTPMEGLGAHQWRARSRRTGTNAAAHRTRRCPGLDGSPWRACQTTARRSLADGLESPHGGL